MNPLDTLVTALDDCRSRITEEGCRPRGVAPGGACWGSIEARFIRTTAHLGPWFPFVPQRPGYNKRLRRSGELMRSARWPGTATPTTTDVWVVDRPRCSARSREYRQARLTSPDGPPTATEPPLAMVLKPRLHHDSAVGAAGGLRARRGQKPMRARSRCLDMITHAGIARLGQTLIADKGCTASRVDASSRPPASPSSAPPPKQSCPDPGGGSCARCARSSNRSTGPSKPNSASNATAAAPAPASPRAYCNESSPSQQPSGTTKPPNNPAPPAP